jgi:K+-sensing histidine kinase KdpD
VTRAKRPTLARLGSLPLSRAPLPAPLGLGVSVGCIAAETAVVLLLKALAPDNAFGVLYLIGVLIVATGWSFGLTAATAVVSAVAYDYLRSWPDVSGVMTKIDDWVVIFVFIVVALVAHLLARIARTRAVDAEQRRQEAEASREQLAVLAEQQAALRRVATLVARGVPASEIFPAVAHELAASALPTRRSGATNPTAPQHLSPRATTQHRRSGCPSGAAGPWKART